MAQPPKLPPVKSLESQPPSQMQQVLPQHYAPPPPPPHHPPQQPSPTNEAQQPYQQQQGPVYSNTNGHAQSQYSPPGINGTNGVPNGNHRVLYPIPPQNGADTRPVKREIKRRTKTGCLTCRKRRIKCDEGHPSCRNCQKSKRECLGYDPIFKSQGPNTDRDGPSLVQLPPHPISLPPLINGHPPSYPPTHHYQAQAPAPGHGAPITLPPVQTLEPSSHHDTALDPALGTASSGPALANPAPVPAPPPATAPDTGISELRPFRKRKPIWIEDLFLADGASPSTLPAYDPSAPPPSDAEIVDIKALFTNQYAPALNTFFETTWYTEHGTVYILTRSSDVQFLAHCSRIFKSRPASTSSEGTSIPSIETKLVWILATLARRAWEATQSADTQLADLLHRLDVLEHLVIGAILPTNLVPPAPQSPKNPPPDAVPTQDFLSHSFWYHLGTFAAQDDCIPTYHQQSNANHLITTSMSSMRQILSVLENRDVLYSIAIARHIGGRLEKLDDGRTLVGRSSDPEEAMNKFGVAWRFLGDEEVVGTTGVVRGLAGMGRRGVFRGRVEEEERNGHVEAKKPDERHEAAKQEEVKVEEGESR
ncbi:hypothetical protein B9Z65_2251 [Elsinoe australis]|uniref:Zn(2)-C6 fungal-type domain-containing protein n=1 Tax=Elsinoe australis TaxID=40998 RepID=A0A2P7YNI0_9PEZI|nr:hypothetical protein B9Z65_2251 [Elsinoe australis]